jgi:cytochrome P450
MASVDPYLPGGPEFIRDPYPYYDRLRNADPVHWSEVDAAWFVSRYEDVLSGVRDPRLSARRMSALLSRVDLPDRHRTLIEQHTLAQMISADPPEHGRMRGLASRAFTPRSMARLQPRIAQIADALLDGVLDEGRMDAVADYAFPLPMAVIGELLGIPGEDFPVVKGWADTIAGFMSSGRVEKHEVEGYLTAWQEIADYVRALASRRVVRAEDDDIVGLLLRRQQAGDATEEEVVANLVLFAVAGHETTTNTFALGLWTLLNHRPELERLWADPGLIPSAVEEILRYEPTSHRTIRIAREPITIGDRKVPNGGVIVFLLGAANRDPEAFADPWRFDVGRHPNRHLTFSQGIHFCLGAPLARLELQESLAALLRRTRNIETSVVSPTWRPNVRMRGLLSLPVTFDVA